MVEVLAFASVFFFENVLIDKFQKRPIVDFFLGKQFYFLCCLFAKHFFNSGIDPLGEGSAVDDVHLVHSHGVNSRNCLDVLVEGGDWQAQKLFLEV